MREREGKRKKEGRREGSGEGEEKEEKEKSGMGGLALTEAKKEFFFLIRRQERFRPFSKQWVFI